MKKLLRELLMACGVAALSVTSTWATDSPPAIPAGTILHVRLTTTLTTKSNQTGDPFTGEVEDPIFASGQEIVPAGSTVDGRVSYVRSPGRAKGVAGMRLVIDTITTRDGKEYSITASLQEAQGAEGAKVKGEEGTIQGPGKSKKREAEEAGIGAGVGAGIGAMADGGSGALTGAAVGAGAALLHGLFKRHKDIILPPGTDLTFVISRPMSAKSTTKTNETPAQ